MLKYEEKKLYLNEFTNDEIIYYVIKAKEKDIESLNFLIDLFESYIKNLAKKYSKDKFILDDLIQEGKIALIYAINKYNYSKSTNFKYYAIMWIKQAVYRYYQKIVDDISIPLRKRQIIRKIKKLLNCDSNGNFDNNFNGTFEIKYNKISNFIDDNDCNINSLNLNENYLLENNDKFENLMKKKNFLQYDYKFISIENENSSEENYSIYNYEKYNNYKEKDPIEYVEKDNFFEKVYKALENLNDREKIVIFYRFGLNNYPELTLKEISKIYNLSSEAIRKIEKRAIDKLKEKLKNL
jgi:RNA polymerase sigma factor (sigma-70 family)